MAAVPVLDERRFGYLKPADVARLAEAYRFSGVAHAGQRRQSGEPYVSHPLAAPEILPGWRPRKPAPPRPNRRPPPGAAPAKRRRVARETMEIYAPIANRLGLNALFHELQELAFAHLYPLRFRVLFQATRPARGTGR